MRARHLLNLASDRLHTLPLLVLYLTDGCNSRCVTCDIWRNPRRNMSPELVETLAGAMNVLQTRWVLLSGGEAMQHPRWPEIARRFRAAGATVMLLTNGLLLKKQAADVIASVDEVIVSLDGGTAETYHAIRGVDAFDLVLEGIRAVRAGGVSVATRTTVQRANFRDIPQIIETAKAAGVNRISFLTVDVSNAFAFGPRFGNGSVPPFHALERRGEDIIPLIASAGPGSPAEHGPAASALTPDEVSELAAVLDHVEQRFGADFASGLLAESPQKMRRMVDYFAALNGLADFPRPRCNAPHLNLVVEVDGTLRPCYFLPSFGKIDRGTRHAVSDIINNPAALALRHAYRTGQRPECERCVCPLYKGPRALLRL
ncbi:MAG: radical SAM protein [Chloroflexi bacterium]|nr:radical SAM protein [Chloroflexota bacterium]